MLDVNPLLSNRLSAMDASGIRRVFELGAKLKDPINLSIGQPDFAPPEAMKRAAIEAIEQDRSGYTMTQGVAPLRERIASHLHADLGWAVGADLPSAANPDEPGVLVTSGTSGALLLTAFALLDPGDEYVIPDPYFVLYPSLGTMLCAKAVLCDTYPDFCMTAQRLEPLLTERTKFVIANSPSNPAGVVASSKVCRELRELCESRGVLLVSDEIYDGFAFDDHLEGGACPSPCRDAGAFSSTLVVRGFGKTYGCTGWRMGYVSGPGPVLSAMAKAQQYSFVCAPSVAQWGCVPALDQDMRPTVRAYQSRRDMVLHALRPHTEVVTPGGSFFAFPKAPEGVTGTEFVERCIERGVLAIPGSVFSSRDTHWRLSYAVPEDRLAQGLEVISALYAGLPA